MATLLQLSESNFQNTIGAELAQQFLSAGYLVYWHERDGVETPDGYYGQYSTRQDALALDSTFATRLANAKALITLRGPLTANPQFVTRPSSSGGVAGPDTIPIPAFAVDVGPVTTMDRYELGTSRKWRTRHLAIYGFARTRSEQSVFADLLASWFDEDVVLTIRDHDGGSLDALADARVDMVHIARDIAISGPEVTTYAVELNARLEYVA